MPGGFIAAQKLTVTILFSLFSLFLFSCSQLPIENNQIGDKIQKQTLKMLSQQIENILLKSIPLDLTSVDQFTAVNKLPGPAFRPSNLKVNPLQNIEFDLNGNLLLAKEALLVLAKKISLMFLIVLLPPWMNGLNLFQSMVLNGSHTLSTPI